MRALFYSFRAVLIAAAIIGAVELSCWIFAGREPLAASNFLELAYLKVENSSKIALMSRTRWTISLHPDILQVGDSSGLHGSMPRVIDTYLGGLNYVSDSFGADVGYLGHYNVAETVVDRVSSVKAIVLYVTPLAKPAFYGNAGRDLERSIYSAFISPWQYLAPPMLSYRIGATNLLYYGELNNETPHGVTGFLGDTNWRESFFDSKGFIPREAAYHVRDPLPLGACPFANWFDRSAEGLLPFDLFYAGLEKFALLAREKKLHLMVVFNPVPCHEDNDVKTLMIERELARFRHNFPEVVMPFSLITTWPEDRYMDSWHFFSFGAKIMSDQIGPDIERMMVDPLYRGVPPQSGEQIDAELDQARHRVERPTSCEETTSTAPQEENDGGYTNCIGLHFVTLPAGHFIMGSCDSTSSCPPRALPDIHARPEEMVAHPVSIARPFQISESPVTIEQFQVFLKSPQALADDVATDVLAIDPLFLNANEVDSHRPVTMVSWNNAQAFVQWLNEVKAPSDKGIYRLPTEAEWEYAARSDSQTAYWWGAEPETDMADCLGCTERFGGKPAPVASFMPNLFGLYDMNGNVWEMVEDCYRGWYGAAETDARPYERPDCNARSLRGGGADMPDPYWSRATSRLSNNPSSRTPTVGFRVVRDVDPSDPSAVPVQPAHIVSDGQPLASSDNSGSPTKAFDNDKATFWLSAEHGAQIKDHAWIGYKFAKPMKVGWIRIDQTNNPPFREDLVRVESSNDGETWTPALPEPVHLVGTTDWIYLPSSSPASIWRVVAADDSTPPRDTWAVIELGLYVRDGDIHAGNSR